MADVPSLILYVAGPGPRADQARHDVRVLVGDEAWPSVEVVDVLAEPGRAERDGVLATPTLVHRAATPPVRVVGALGNTELVRRSLGLQARPPAPPEESS